MNVDSKNKLNRAGMLFAFSLIIHLALLPYFSSIPYFDGISSGFISTAGNLLDGKGFTEQVSTEKGIVYQSAVWNPPVYSLFVFSSFFLFGKSVFAFRILQIALLSLVPPLLYLFSRNRLGEKYALLLAIITALYLPNLRLSSTILSEVLFGPLLLFSAILFLDKRYFWAGIVFGMASLTRDFGIMFALAFLIYPFLARQEKPLKTALVFLAATFIVVFPWMARNEYYYGHFVISAPKTGISLWEGIGEFDSAGKFGAPWGDENLVKSENTTSFLYPDPFSRDGIRVQKALNVIEHNPVWYTGVVARRVPQLLFMNLGAGVSKTFKETLIYTFKIMQVPALVLLLLSEKNGIILAAMWAEQLFVYAFALAGTYYAIRQRKKELYLFILLIAIMLANIVHHVEPRYFVPVNYFVLFIAVYGIRESKFLEKVQKITLRVMGHEKRLRK